jgi:hypothetical protein
MQESQSIGTLAENIIAVSFRLDGTVTPIIRRREATGRMVDVASFPSTRQGASRLEFVARIEKGNSAVAAVGPGIWRGTYAVAVIPLGHQSAPSHELVSAAPVTSSISSEPGAGPAAELRFSFADGKLSWSTENLFGETVLNETYPDLTVTLRLPPGNHGEISFAAPLFTTPEGEHTSVLSVA